MQLRICKWLEDIRTASADIVAFVQGRAVADLSGDRLLRLAIERQFITIGEAMTQIARMDPAVAARVGEYRSTIAFRNLLVHRYWLIDDEALWGIIQNDVSRLLAAVTALLAQEPD